MSVLFKILFCFFLFMQAMMIVAMKESYGYFGAIILFYFLLIIDGVILWKKK